jgi:hypothetical protein
MSPLLDNALIILLVVAALGYLAVKLFPRSGGGKGCGGGCGCGTKTGEPKR